MRICPGNIEICLVAAIASALLCGGCATMTLYAAGKFIADHRLQEGPLPRCDNAGIRVGERIDLTLKDGRHVKGYFRKLDCESDSTLILGPYANTSWDIAFGDPDTQRIRISMIRIIRVPNHSFERPVLAVGIVMDAVLIALVASWASGMQGIGD